MKKPIVERGLELKTEIPILLNWHDADMVNVPCWNMDTDEAASIDIPVVNCRSGTHLYDIFTIDRDITIRSRKHYSMKTFLMRNGLNVDAEQIREWLWKAYDSHGNSHVLKACLLSGSIHGLIGIDDFPSEDKMLIQTNTQAHSKPDGQFVYPKAKLLNKWLESIDSPKRFTMRFMRHKVIK